MKKLVCCTAALLILVTALFLPTSCKPAAQFELVSLDIEPPEAVGGQQLSATIKVTNVGGVEGSYTAILKINGFEIDRKTVKLSPRSTETVTFVFVRDLPGNYDVEIGGLRRSAIIKVAKAEFEVMSVNILPPETTVGKAVTITSRVRNKGTSLGWYTVILTVNDVAEQTKYIILPPGTSRPVTFLLSKDLAGTYEVRIGELTSTLKVQAGHVVEDRVLLENVPLVIQRGHLDCCLASRAMLLKYYKNEITYEQSLYESGACHGLVYKPRHLSFGDLGFISWYEDFYWLATLYGLTFEPREATSKGEEEAWNEFIDRICKYLKRGVPVQIHKSWYPLSYPQAPWWGAIPLEHAPYSHGIVVVGVDRSKGVVYIHSPWPTIGKMEMTLQDLKTSIEFLGHPHLRYSTMTFLRTPLSGIAHREWVVKERNLSKLRGDPNVYYEWFVRQGYTFGMKALEAWSEDLHPENFFKIIEEKERRGITAAETVTWISLFMYQHSFLSNLGAEYLKGMGKTSQEQNMLENLHTSYDTLHTLAEELELVFESSEGTNEAMLECEPILEEMRKVITEMIEYVKDYL